MWEYVFQVCLRWCLQAMQTRSATHIKAFVDCSQNNIVGDKNCLNKSLLVFLCAQRTQICYRVVAWAPWCVLGHPLGPTWASLGLHWGLQGLPWVPKGCHLGATWVPKGCQLGATWVPKGCPCGSLGPLWGSPGPPWAHLGCPGCPQVTPTLQT